MIKVKCGSFGTLAANNYLIIDSETNESALVDCSSDSSDMISFIGDTDLKYILLTHGHFDHCDGVRDIAKLKGAEIVISSYDSSMSRDTTLNVSRLISRGEWKEYTPDITIDDGDYLTLGKEEIKVIATPGHTPGSVCYIIGNHLFTGDTVMVGGVGRTDFPGGNQDQLIESLNKIMPLTKENNVYPGHGTCVIRD
ncbi:MAG: MBL fold metallo-hydrolase [Ruminococcaceae bacterium]|nr:MBL fold metallo-hydrolase [Oscillospiraceae bacterium]